MKATALTVPLVIVVLIFVFVLAIGLMTVKSSAIATQGSIELLRLHMDVARLHDELLAHSRETLGGGVADLTARVAESETEMPARGSVETAAGVVTARHDAAAPHPGPAPRE